MTELIVPVCHVDLLEHERLTAPSDVGAQTFITYTTQPYTWPEWLERAGVPGLRPAGTLHFEQMYFVLQATAEGLGVVLVPLFLVVDDIISGKLAAPFGLLAARQRQYYANYPTSASNSPVVQAFCKWLVHEGSDTERTMGSWAESMGWKL